jgi:thiol-disulfide isomerase/thioredoxin
MVDYVNPSRRNLLCAVAMTIAASQFNLVAYAKAPTGAAQLPVEGGFPSLAGATEWLNSPPLPATGLRGKVVLVDFWTYTCINWRRTLPYLRAWAQKYKDHGLIVIGVHTPEFSFEHNAENVRWAIQDMKISYPIAIDSRYAIWQAFNNEYWPALYFVDAKGRIRHHQFGEGGYDRSEWVIQQLLIDAGFTGFDRGRASITATGVEVAADWASLKSPESYVGYSHTENFASPGGVAHDKLRTYALPAQLKLNHWAIEGDWTIGKEALALNAPNGRVVYEFHARDLHLVMGAATGESAVRFRVYLDGKPPGGAHGLDVDENGNGVVARPRLYQLLRQTGTIADRRFEIEFLDSNVEVFDFTFG